MTLHALMLREGPLHEERILTRKMRSRTRLLLQLAALVSGVKVETLLERELEAAQVEIGIGRLRVSPAIAHVYLLVGVQHEVVQSGIPIAIEEADIDIVHPHDANTHILAQLLAQRRIFR